MVAEVNFIFRVVVSFMAQGEEGSLAGIREGNEGDEFGEMEAGPADGRMGQRSPLLGRALDDSLLAAQGTPSVVQMEAEVSRRYIAQMETEITRRAEAEVARCMAAFQQQRFMADREGLGDDVGGYREEPGFGAQFADVDVNVQGRQYAPPPFGRAGPAMGPVIRNNPSQLYRAVVGGQVTPAAFNGGAQQQWLPVRMDASPSTRMPYHDMPMVQVLRQPPPFTVLARPTTALPSTVAADQSASIFGRLDAAFQELQHGERMHGPQFWMQYLRDERALRTVNLGEAFSMAQFERGASAALRTTLRHLFDILYAYNGLAPHRDHFSLLVLAPKFTKAAKPVADRACTAAMQSLPGTRIRMFFEGMITAYVDPNMPRLLKKHKRRTLDSWTDDISIHAVREVVLALMHEWAQAVEDTSAAPGLQRIDAMSEKMWMEALEDVWPAWVAALYLTEQHQFGNTVEELFHFLQTREPETSPARSCAPMTAMVPQDFSGMSVEDALHLGYNQQIACLLALSRQVRCWRCLQNHYVSECRAKRSDQEIAGLPRPWPPMPPHESQASLHQLAAVAPPVAAETQGMVAVLASLEGIRQDLQTHQMSIQDQAATQGEMAQALLTLCTQLNMINK